MRYHLFQKFFGKMVKIKETSFLSTRGMTLMFGNCKSLKIACKGLILMYKSIASYFLIICVSESELFSTIKLMIKKDCCPIPKSQV